MILQQETVLNRQAISPETRELLERYVAIHGVKKSHLIETAVLQAIGWYREVKAMFKKNLQRDEEAGWYNGRCRNMKNPTRESIDASHD